MENSGIFIEIIGAAIGLVYLFLEYKCSVWLWLAGIIMSLFYIMIFYNSGFYASSVIYGWYLFTNIYGWLVWTRGRKPSEDSQGIQNINTRIILWSTLAFAIIWFVIYNVLIKFPDSSVPLGDSFIFALSFVATFWVAHKFLQHWWLWVVVNVMGVLVYFSGGLMFITAMSVIYTIVSVLGYFKWKKIKNSLV
jgi:nicotinamide mononucleotide transporter